MPLPRRNHADSIRHAQLAEETNEPVFGIIGTSPVHSIMKIPDMLLLDYVHQVLEGEYTRRFFGLEALAQVMSSLVKQIKQTSASSF